jgi:hypothetical protein
MPYKGILKQTAFSISAISVILLTLEMGFRVYYFIKKEPIKSEYIIEGIKNDSLLGWVLQPNCQRYAFDPKGNKFLIKTNSEGLKTGEFPAIKPKNTIRIFCMGDSIVEGSTCASNEDSYPNLLEDMLNKYSYNVRYEVFNCGISDYGIRQEYLLLRHRLLKYRPDIVILGYYLNDGKTFLRQKNTFLAFSSNKTLKNSALYYGLEKLVMKYMIKIQYKFWEKNRFMWKDLYFKKSWRTNKKHVDTLIGMADRDWGIAWTQNGKKEVFDYLRKFLDLSKKNNFQFVILCLPVEMQVYAAGAEKLDLFKPQKDIQLFCDENAIPFINPLPHLTKRKDEEVYLDQCHYTLFGLRAIAKIVFEQLREQRIIQSGGQ